MTKGVKNWQERDCFRQLQQFLESDETDRVCLVFGLRRTGKTTMLRQSVLKMTSEQASKTAYIKAKATDTMASMNRDLEKVIRLSRRKCGIWQMKKNFSRQKNDSAA